MIYLVTKQTRLFDDAAFQIIDVDKSIEMISQWRVIQYDCETTGRDPHLCTLLCAQFGNKEAGCQIVVDCETIDILRYKELLESKYIIGQNLKFDLQFLYNYGIVPRKVYDTMIVEQLLYLGYPSGMVGYSLKDIAHRRLGIDIDKSIRGQIIWKGLSTDVIAYAAGDVTYLEDIADLQYKECVEKGCVVGAKLECDFVPAIAYLEWCGIKLDEKKWRVKMEHDKENLQKALDALNEYCIKHPKLQKWVWVDPQGDLFTGFDLSPKFRIDWQKDEAKEVFKALGFNLKTISKTTKKETESVQEKNLTTQKGIDDEFLKLYLDYQGYYKLTTTYGQGHLDLINPVTGRLHTNYWQIGTATGRMSSGSGTNDDLTKYKKLHRAIKMVNMQQLPHDKETRACFVAEKGNLFCSCDFSAMEARLGAEVYNEKKLLDEFLYGSGDSHAAYAKAVFSKELEGIDTRDVKKKRPDLRNKVKSIEFAIQFGSDGTAVAPQLGIPVEEARKMVTNLLSEMTGLAAFKKTGSKFVRNNGYVLICKETGHKQFWWDWKNWCAERSTINSSEFRAEYLARHKGTGDSVDMRVRENAKAASAWDRAALNSPTQGAGAIILKDATTTLFNWIVDNGYFGKILLVNLTHDEINSEFPLEIKDFYPNFVAKTMQESAAKFCHKLPIPAEAEVGEFWIH